MSDKLLFEIIVNINVDKNTIHGYIIKTNDE